MSNKGLSKHTLSNYSKRKPKLPRYIKKGYKGCNLLPNRAIKHRKHDSRSGYKLIDNYLETKLGCNWDEVYSELKTKIGNFDCSINVETNVIITDKVYYYFRGKLSELQPESFYVDSEGLLQQVCKTRKSWNKTPEPIVIKIDDDHEYRYLHKTYWDKEGWYYYYKKVTKEVKKKLVVDKDGKPVFYNRLNCRILDPMLLGTLMFTYETVEKVTWERYPISGWCGNANYHKLKLLKQGMFV